MHTAHALSITFGILQWPHSWVAGLRWIVVASPQQEPLHQHRGLPRRTNLGPRMVLETYVGHYGGPRVPYRPRQTFLDFREWNTMPTLNFSDSSRIVDVSERFIQGSKLMSPDTSVNGKTSETSQDWFKRNKNQNVSAPPKWSGINY